MEPNNNVVQEAERLEKMRELIEEKRARLAVLGTDIKNCREEHLQKKASAALKGAEPVAAPKELAALEQEEADLKLLLPALEKVFEKEAAQTWAEMRHAVCDVKSEMGASLSKARGQCVDVLVVLLEVLENLEGTPDVTHMIDRGSRIGREIAARRWGEALQSAKNITGLIPTLSFIGWKAGQKNVPSDQVAGLLRQLWELHCSITKHISALKLTMEKKA